jgi:hypothetical protein
MIVLVASLMFATMLQAPTPAQQSSPDVVPQRRRVLTAIVAGDVATVEKQFTDDLKTAPSVHEHGCIYQNPRLGVPDRWLEIDRRRQARGPTSSGPPACHRDYPW